MNKASISGSIASFLGLLGLIYFLVSDAKFPLEQWPNEAFQSLVFVIVLSFHVSPSVAYFVSAVFVVSVLVVCFAIGHKLARCIWEDKAAELSK
ncbi:MULTISPECIES: hypothetical protein [Vibrio]|uniref:Uncharacterized protein n=1 Tax=Vibrio algicola TaxID=2662262 RepID=A0A5Q0TJ13_9VIBR|nr:MULTISPECIES: hypothetical protein [Vibrio]MBD1577422.1 hypothetical protein [Vibrio sp. S11_S32]